MANAQGLANTPVLVVSAATAASADPTTNTAGYNTNDSDKVRVYAEYAAATVTSLTIRIWAQNPKTKKWAKGLASGDTGIVAMSPGGGTPVNEYRDFTVGRNQIVTVQLSAVSVSGSGAVSLYLGGLPVDVK